MKPLGRKKNTRVDEQTKVITSWPVLLNFTAQPGQTYRLALEEPQDLQSAEAFAVNPKIWIQEDLTGKRVASSTTLREARERSLASRKSPTLPQDTGGLAPIGLTQVLVATSRRDRKTTLSGMAPAAAAINAREHSTPLV